MFLNTIYGTGISVSRIDKRTLRLSFNYNPKLVDWVKTLQGRSFKKEDNNAWHVTDCTRNLIQFARITGNDPYSAPVVHVNIPPEERLRPLYSYQWEGVEFILTVKQVELAEEPGLGKTLQAIEAIERIQKLLNQVPSVLWLSTLNAIHQTRLELKQWKCNVPLTYIPGEAGIYLLHYNMVGKLVANWPVGRKSPRILIVDECQRCKNPETIMARSVQYIADNMRAEHPDAHYIINMTGTPSAKDPTDWWSQLEIIAPGFIAEGSKSQLAKTVGFVNLQEAKGRIFNKTDGWRNNPELCDVCGIHKNSHDPVTLMAKKINLHPHKPSRDVVAEFVRSLAPRVFVRTKAECLDLPAKIYRKIVLSPSRPLLQAAKLIANGTGGASTVLTKLRELSDGFQYRDTFTKKPCTSCSRGFDPSTWRDSNPSIPDDDIDDNDTFFAQPALDYAPDSPLPCAECHDAGYTLKRNRHYEHLHNDKIDALAEVVEEIEDSDSVNRMICFAGFKASVDECVKLFLNKGWHVIKIDGRGCYWQENEKTPPRKIDVGSAIELFQNNRIADRLEQRNIAWVGHPMSGGVGTTLTAAETMVFLSNDFNWETRDQAEGRIHRITMRGANIIDIFNLPIDHDVVFKNLMAKKSLQSISMDEIRQVLDDALMNGESP